MEDFPHRTDRKKKELSLHSKTEEFRIEYRDIICLMQSLTLRRLMSYIYMEHPFLMFLDHTQ